MSRSNRRMILPGYCEGAFTAETQVMRKNRFSTKTALASI
jgi:hypothetical protein